MTASAVMLVTVSALVAQFLIIVILIVVVVRGRRGQRAASIELNRRLVQVREDERRVLARELHDDIAQRITLMSMEVQHLQTMLHDGEPAAQSLATAVHGEIVALAADVQDLSRRVHSSKLDLLGLAMAAGNHCKDISARHGVEVEYVHESVPAHLPPELTLALFRVLQEALSNAVRHAGARRCIVTLLGAADALTLGVADDGRGFDVAARKNGDGLGLVSMQERMRLVNGEMLVESAPGQGTRVRARAPLR